MDIFNTGQEMVKSHLLGLKIRAVLAYGGVQQNLIRIIFESLHCFSVLMDKVVRMIEIRIKDFIPMY